MSYHVKMLNFSSISTSSFDVLSPVLKHRSTWLNASIRTLGRIIISCAVVTQTKKFMQQMTAGPNNIRQTRKRGNCECIATRDSPTPSSPYPFNFGAHVKLISYVTLWPWTLTPWPRPLTLNICSIPVVPRSNSVPNLSAIEQSTAELLRFEYLTIWPWTCHVLRQRRRQVATARGNEWCGGAHGERGSASL